MKLQSQRYYYVYIVTNKYKTTMETGLTADLQLSVSQLEFKARRKSEENGENCFLVYWERLTNVEEALEREKELKESSRRKKEQIIRAQNPDWRFFNNDISEVFPVL